MASMEAEALHSFDMVLIMDIYNLKTIIKLGIP